jgi:MFS family permease
VAGSVSRRLNPVTSGGPRVIGSAALANLGDGIRQVALPLLVVSVTRDPVAVSLLTAVSYLPWALLGLPIGAYVDRSSPAAVAAGANIGRAVLLAALCAALLAGQRSLAVLYVVVFLLGVGEAAYDNAAQSLLPQVVADAALEKANSALAIVEQAGLDLAGPALGGVIFAMSAALPFGINALGLIIGAALIARIPVARRPAGARPSARAFLGEVPAGLRWLWRSGFVRLIIVTGAGLTFFTQMWVPLLVLLATGPMGLSKAGYGVLLALGAIGGVAGAAATPLLIRRFEHRALQVLALAATAAGVLALAAFPTPVVAALVWGDTGFTFALWNVLSVTLRQRLVPPGLLGRVNSASRTLSTTAVPLGALIGGAIAGMLGLRASFWLSGLAVAILAVTFTLTRPAPRPCRPGPENQAGP